MSSKPSFPYLDGIRFVAALLVFTAHFFEFFHYQKINFFIYNLDVQRKFGATGVTIFFVLSGFLITCLLLQEQVTKNVIAIKKFYLRRILRIWPLYFFIVVLSFWVLNNMSFFMLQITTPITSPFLPV